MRALRITTAAQALARDAQAIAAGIESWSLMEAAGSRSASLILEQRSDRLADGVAVYAGPGNNGGDASVVAAILARAGIHVRFRIEGTPRSPDAKRAFAMAEKAGVTIGASTGSEQLVVDGLLGTGQSGELRDEFERAALEINAARTRGATVVALDIPTGVNATSGAAAEGAVHADATYAYGTFKRAHVIARPLMGDVYLLDIGLGAHAELPDDAWHLADAPWLHSVVPVIDWDSHKGRRGRLAITGGAPSMAGAVILAARAALGAGVGLVNVHVARSTIPAVQSAVPEALAFPWSRRPKDLKALVVGPGLGRGAKSVQVLRDAMRWTPTIPTVLDADALTLLANSGKIARRFQGWVGARPLVLTPHLGEFARLIEQAAPDALEDRVAKAEQLASDTGSVVLLKGTPSVVVSGNGTTPIVVARGTPVLATGGSGDLLSGIIGALLGQGAPPAHAAAIGAWIHGRSAEIATSRGGNVRGVTLSDVLMAFPEAWNELANPPHLPASVLAVLPRVWSSG